MRRRILAVLVGVTGLVVLSMSGDAAAGGASAPVAPTSATAASTATAATASPAFECEPGLFTTICQIVFAPFCTLHPCYAGTATAARTASTPAAGGWEPLPVQCSGLIVPACDAALGVVGIVCHDRCDAAPARSSAATPAFYCAAGPVGTICNTVLGPICDDHCLAATAPSRTAPAPAVAPRVSVAAPVTRAGLAG